MQAVSLHQCGKLDEAETVYNSLLKKNPRDSDALHYLGLIAFQKHNYSDAIKLIEAAIKINNKIPGFHCNLGNAYKASRQFDSAIAAFLEAVRLDPKFHAAHSNLGNTFKEQGKLDKAVASYRNALAINPDFAEAYNNLASVLHDQDKLDEAASNYRKALSLNPNYTEAICNFGGVHLALEDHYAALGCFQRALTLRPMYIEAQMGLAKTFQGLDNLSEAENAALKAIKIDNSNPKAHALLGSIFAELARPEAAEDEFGYALSLDSKCDDALLGMGHLCMERGQIDRAEELFLSALAFKPDNIAARFNISQARKTKVGDANFSALLQAEKESAEISESTWISLHFALGKCYDDIKDYDHAFPHFLAGCKIKRSRLHYDAAKVAKQFALIMDFFNPAMIERLQGSGDPSNAPIFVLGMPRSGTTLTEQIIASHPDVYGAGELQDLLRIAERNYSGSTAETIYPNNLNAIDSLKLTAWGAEYIAGLRQRTPSALRITDKMPANFFALGLIHLMLPNAKIIHVNRNPVDTCLSCFTRLFDHKQEHTYDLVELGQYYAHYSVLMDYWRRVLPEGAFLDVYYEDIVADQEGQARNLIDFCGLQWNQACLDFYNTNRSIRTASMTQVRQPIYNSSVERWRHYEKFLDPLLDELGDLVPNR